MIPASPLRIDFALASDYVNNGMLDHVSPIEEAFGDSDDPVLDSRLSPRLRLSVKREFGLGEGRHASVFMASFIPLRPKAANGEENGGTREKWHLCAAKRLLPDSESQIAGLGEAFILSKLAGMSEEGAEFILKLYGVRFILFSSYGLRS